MLRAIAAAALLAAAQPQWTAEELSVMRDMHIGQLGAPPADPTNRFADDPAAAKLGRALFEDPGFSANGQVACASCHRPDHGLTDDAPLARGVGTGSRRTMPIAPALYSHWQFWDGRADSLWAQALGPLENPAAHGATRVQVARRFVAAYAGEYRAVFGEAPDLSDVRRFPPVASPLGGPAGRAAWAGMAAEDRLVVDRVFVNFGRSIAAFERTVPTAPSRFDAYVAAVLAGRPDDRSLSPEERKGLKLFIGKANCVDCHNGPLLTNHEFANTGVPARRGLAPDEGRFAGLGKALADPFNCSGAFSDAPGRCEELEFAAAGSPETMRAYKVPSLRGVADRPPYMHAGQYATLSAVISHYDRAPRAPHGSSQLRPLRLTAAERRQIEAFLRSLGPRS